MNVQVILVAIGAIFILLAVVGSADSVQLKIAHLGSWARATLGIVGIISFGLAFTPIAKSISNTSAAQPLPLVNSTRTAQSSASVTPTPIISISSPTPVTSTPVTSPSPASTSPTTAGTPHVTLDTPKPGTNVSSSKGFPVTGTVSSLGADTIWILDNNGGGSYTVNESATVTLDGRWTAFDGPGLGNSSSLVMDVVLADSSCTMALSQHTVAPNSSDISPLPPRCKIVTEVKVNVSQP